MWGKVVKVEGCPGGGKVIKVEGCPCRQGREGGGMPVWGQGHEVEGRPCQPVM